MTVSFNNPTQLILKIQKDIQPDLLQKLIKKE